eukprot:UN11375
MITAVDIQRILDGQPQCQTCWPNFSSQCPVPRSYQPQHCGGVANFPRSVVMENYRKLHLCCRISERILWSTNERRTRDKTMSLGCLQNIFMWEVL